MEQSKETFVDIPGYEGLYAANQMGEIWSHKHSRLLTPQNSHHGYKRIRLYKDGQYRTFAVHRIVAFMFVENPNNYSEVNHKNENTSDNRAENLEWCDRKYNVNYGHRLEKFRKQVAEYNLDGSPLAVYPSQKTASKMTGASQGAISNACLGRAKTAIGHLWKIIEDIEKDVIFPSIYGLKNQERS